MIISESLLIPFGLIIIFYIAGAVIKLDPKTKSMKYTAEHVRNLDKLKYILILRSCHFYITGSAPTPSKILFFLEVAQ
jgi:hypothetical protein